MEVYGGLRKAFVRLFIIKSSGPSTGVLRPGLDFRIWGFGMRGEKNARVGSTEPGGPHSTVVPAVRHPGRRMDRGEAPCSAVYSRFWD